MIQIKSLLYFRFSELFLSISSFDKGIYAMEIPQLFIGFWKIFKTCQNISFRDLHPVSMISFIPLFLFLFIYYFFFIRFISHFPAGIDKERNNIPIYKLKKKKKKIHHKRLENWLLFQDFYKIQYAMQIVQCIYTNTF